MKSLLGCRACILCDSPTSSSLNLCEYCLNELPKLENTCWRCALPLNETTKDEIYCGHCLQTKKIIDHTVALWHYEQPLPHFITALKFRAKLIVAKVFGELFAEHLSSHYSSNSVPETIIPMPLHPQRLRERGFNQALEIAKPIAKHLNIPIDMTLAHRVRATPPQSSTPAKARYKNIKNAFSIEKPCADHIAIIDDVITTGSTVRELSRVLRKAGAKHIDVWCVARTVINASNHKS